MISDELRELSKAKTTAFRFLKIRERSVFELRQKLSLKKLSPKAIEGAIDFLLAKKFLDDQTFARNWIRYRQSRPLGPARIRMELQQKGVDKEIIAEELELAFSEVNQEETVLDLASRRAARYRKDDPVKRKRKVFDFLARRGYSLDIITKAIKKI